MEDRGRIAEAVMNYGSLLNDSAESSVALIVTAVRGGRKEPAAPFQSPFAEDDVRVPLWLVSGDGVFRRVESISGSFDVLPTIADLFGLAEDWRAASAPDEIEFLTVDSHGSCPAASGEDRPNSLLSLLDESPAGDSRIVVIRTARRMAVRSSEFLLVREAAPQPIPDFTVVPEEISADGRSWLFVKPEDFWNIHDQSGVYEDIVEQMSRYLAGTGTGIQRR